MCFCRCKLVRQLKLFVLENGLSTATYFYMFVFSINNCKCPAILPNGVSNSEKIIFEYWCQETTSQPSQQPTTFTTTIDVDDDVEIAVLIGGWNNDRPVLLRSDGRVCRNSQQDVPPYPQVTNYYSVHSRLPT